MFVATQHLVVPVDSSMWGRHPHLWPSGNAPIDCGILRQVSRREPLTGDDLFQTLEQHQENGIGNDGNHIEYLYI